MEILHRITLTRQSKARNTAMKISTETNMMVEYFTCTLNSTDTFKARVSPSHDIYMTLGALLFLSRIFACKVLT